MSKPLQIDLNTAEGRALFIRTQGGMVKAGDKPSGLVNQIGVWLPKPPRQTHQNARCHWRAKATATKKQRDEAYLAAKFAMGSEQGKIFPWKSATLNITYYTIAPTVDKSNLIGWLKASFDGLQDARLIDNDSGLSFGPVDVIRVKSQDKRKGTFKLIITKTA